MTTTTTEIPTTTTTTTTTTPSTSSASGWDDAPTAYRRLGEGETLATVAQSYGLTVRSLKVRLGKYERGLSPSDRLAGVLPGGGASNSKAPRVATSQAPPQSGASQAVESFSKLMTASALVDTIDGAQQGAIKTGLFLARVKLSHDTKDAIAFSDTEKAMLEPWAGFAIEEIPQMLKDDPALGLKMGGAMLAWILSQRLIMLVSVIKEARRLEAVERHSERMEAYHNEPPRVEALDGSPISKPL